jgi:hypothetical protein
MEVTIAIITLAALLFVCVLILGVSLWVVSSSLADQADAHQTVLSDLLGDTLSQNLILKSGESELDRLKLKARGEEYMRSRPSPLVPPPAIEPGTTFGDGLGDDPFSPIAPPIRPVVSTS